MRTKVLCSLFMLMPFAVHAQTPTPQQLDEMSQRAESLLDSQPEQAAALYKQVLAQRESWPAGWFYLGAALYTSGRFEEARDSFQRGMSLDPKQGTAWGYLGMCEYELRDYQKALADIQKGEQLGLGPNLGFEAAVRQRGALILIRASMFDQAMGQLQPLTKRQLENPALVETAGLCALGLAKLPQDLTPSERAVVDLAGQAQWAAANQESTKAEAAFRELLATFPKEPGVHYAYGLYLMESDQNAALQEFQKELSGNPKHWPSLIASASLQTRRGEPEASLLSIERAEKLAPAAYRWLCEAEEGRTYLSMDKVEKAIVLFEAAAKQAPANAQTHYFLEQAYRRAGRKADAARERAAFVRLKAEQDPLSLPTGATTQP